MAADFGGIHFESLSQAGLVGGFGNLIHLEVSGDLDGPDGHCRALDDGGVGGAVVGVGAVVVGGLFLGFKTTLLGQLISDQSASWLCTSDQF